MPLLKKIKNACKPRRDREAANNEDIGTEMSSMLAPANGNNIGGHVNPISPGQEEADVGLLENQSADLEANVTPGIISSGMFAIDSPFKLVAAANLSTLLAPTVKRRSSICVLFEIAVLVLLLILVVSFIFWLLFRINLFKVVFKSIFH